MTVKELLALPLVSYVDKVQLQLNLTDRQKRIFTLRFKRGYSLWEIAEDIGLSLYRVQYESSIITQKLQHIDISTIIKQE